MDYYAGIDVSLEQSSVCVVDSSGKIVRETRVASEPEALLQHFADLGLPVIRVGLEAGPLSQWLRKGLVNAGDEVVLLETRHVKAALSAMPVKTDRKDARGIAQLLRMGWYRPVHAKSADAQEVRALLVGRRLLQVKLLDVELSIRGILRGYGLKVGEVSRGRFEARIRDLIEGFGRHLNQATGCLVKAARKPDANPEIVDAPDQRSFTSKTCPGPDRARHRAHARDQQWRRAWLSTACPSCRADLAAARRDG